MPRRETQSTQRKWESERAPGFSAQTKHLFPGIYQSTSGQGFAAVVQQGVPFSSKSKELQLSHFPLKAIQWRGWRGGGALALTIAGTAGPAALSAPIMCHTLL